MPCLNGVQMENEEPRAARPHDLSPLEAVLRTHAVLDTSSVTAQFIRIEYELHKLTGAVRAEASVRTSSQPIWN